MPARLAGIVGWTPTPSAMRKIHPALVKIRQRQGRSQGDAVADAATNEAGTLPPADAPLASDETSSSPTGGSEDMPATSSSAVGSGPIAITDQGEEVKLDQSRESKDFEGSGALSRAEFNPTTGDLLVEFKNKKRFLYSNFTKAKWDEWNEAKSAGSWFHHNVRQKEKDHPYKEVTDG